MHLWRGLGSGGGREYPLREKLLERLEGIRLGIVGSSGDIYQGTR